ncbi:hypothetical protein C8R44DRAFT_866329 [Mycena epipterygia]|nr:hypothetical protein C8R44DRAFT_866329 [Mycena epipterygia]
MTFRTDRIRLVGFFRPVQGVSEEDSRTRLTEVVGKIKVLPIMNKHLLKYEVALRIPSGELLNILNQSDNEYSAMLVVETETVEHLNEVNTNSVRRPAALNVSNYVMQALSDPTFLKLLDGAYENIFRRDDMPIFTTEIFSAIDK